VKYFYEDSLPNSNTCFIEVIPLTVKVKYILGQTTSRSLVRIEGHPSRRESKIFL
jgi:hypothetical protein